MRKRLRRARGRLSTQTGNDNSKAVNWCQLSTQFKPFMRFLLQLTPPISFFIVSAITTFLSLAGLYLVRKKYSAEVLKENHEVAAIIFNAFGLFYGALIAFVVFVTWNGYDEATKNLQLEASEALDIFHSAESFPESPRKAIQQGLRDYISAVYNYEV